MDAHLNGTAPHEFRDNLRHVFTTRHLSGAWGWGGIQINPLAGQWDNGHQLAHLKQS